MSPELKAALEASRPDAIKMGAFEDRFDLAGYRGAIRPSDRPIPGDVQIVPDGGANVDGHWFIPARAPESAGVLYLHGGGFVAGSWETHRSIIAHLAEHAGVRFYVPEYRLAPEHPFPSGYEDCWKAWQWFSARVRAAGNAKISIAGDSAGGNLALGLAQRSIANGERHLAALALICPYLDLDPQSSPTVGRSRFWQGFGAHYAPGQDLADPRISPLKGDLGGLPPTFVQIGEADPIAPDGRRFQALAAERGIDVTLDPWAECGHVWHKFAPDVPEAMGAIQNLARFLVGHLRAAPAGAKRQETAHHV